MDKKIRNRILYVTVAILWSVAIYRTWKNHQIKEENETVEIVSVPPISPMQFQKDSFELILPERDPFLNTTWKPVSENIQPEKQEIKKQNPVVKEIEKPFTTVWPKIEYFGFVKNREKNSTLCLLKIDGKQVRIGNGDVYEKIRIVNAFRDSVIVNFSGEAKTFYH
jgi:hypothetical protein